MWYRLNSMSESKATEADIERYVDNCLGCQWAKASRTKQPGLLHPLPVPNKLWQYLTMDLLDVPPLKTDYDCIWVIIDHFSKESVSIPCFRTIIVKDITHIYIQYVYCCGHSPQSIISNHGPQFILAFWKEFCTILGTTVTLTTPFHKETNSQTEIMNQYLLQRLWPYVNHC